MALPPLQFAVGPPGQFSGGVGSAVCPTSGTLFFLLVSITKEDDSQSAAAIDVLKLGVQNAARLSLGTALSEETQVLLDLSYEVVKTYTHVFG